MTLAFVFVALGGMLMVAGGFAVAVATVLEGQVPVDGLAIVGIGITVVGWSIEMRQILER